ncbi:MAG: PTS fructose transporter subunit IIA, partial [Rhodocyclaceae bacterium]|nr:PTS fructose transporter subunit IIA [Rhodocyclaceae bacterium]
MIGIFLITHGSLGESLVQCACHVLNKRPPQLAQLGVSGQDDPLDALPLARDMLRLVDSGKGVLLLTDIFGATPSNIALKLLQPGRIEAVA